MDFTRQTVDSVIIPLKITRNPDGSTVELQLEDGGTWLPCSWKGTAVPYAATRDEPAFWRQEAETDDLLAGADVASPPPGALQLGAKRYLPTVRISWPDGRVVVKPALSDLDAR